MRKDKALMRLLSNPRVIALHYSPSISRTIPAAPALVWPKLLNEWLLIGFVSGVLLFLSVDLGVRIQGQLTELVTRRQARTAVTAEISHWQHYLATHTDYRDGYFRLALLQYQVGNEQLAGMNVEKALALDPNFAAGIAFKEKLQEEE